MDKSAGSVTGNDKTPRPRNFLASASTWMTAALAAVILTPLCGLWFSCGCDWPLSRFFLACDALQPHAPQPHCPWCAHPWTAFSSIAASGAAGFIALAKMPTLRAPDAAAMLYRSGAGIAAFAAALALCGWITARLTHHPSFLGMLVH